MEEFNMLPIYRTGIGEITDGIAIKAPMFCKNKCINKCESYYIDVFNKKHGLNTCPYGFNTYLLKNGTDLTLFTGFRVKGEYNKKKADPKIEKEDINPVIEHELMDKYINAYIKYYKYQNEYNGLCGFINELVHDIRKFNAHILYKSDIILNKAEQDKYKAFHEHAKAISAMSSYVSLRLDAYNFIYNQNPLITGGKSIYNLYKIFDKNKRCFNRKASESDIKISISNNGLCPDIKAYDCIELVPFILIDNGIKYTPKGNNISIYVEDTINYQKVQVESLGPKLSSEELDQIFNKGFRGDGAKKLSVDGSGIGLFTLKNICDLHNMDVNAWSEPKVYKTISGVEYSKFIFSIIHKKMDVG